MEGGMIHIANVSKYTDIAYICSKLYINCMAGGRVAIVLTHIPNYNLHQVYVEEIVLTLQAFYRLLSYCTANTNLYSLSHALHSCISIIMDLYS